MRVLTSCVALGVALIVGSARGAEPPGLTTKRACAAAASEGQASRDAGRLLEARARFISCAQPSCPAVIRKDCANWQAEVEARTPSVVLSARDVSTGRDVSGARFTVDGKSIQGDEGRAISVDPGPHEFGAAAPGLDVSTEKAIVREGERARSIVIRVGTIVESECFLNPNSPACRPPQEPKAGPGPLPYVLGGVGVAGIGAGIALYVVTKNELSDTARRCGQTSESKAPCTEDERASIKTKYTLEIISFAVGGAALATSVVLFSTHAFAVKTAPVPGGAKAEFVGRF